MARKKTKVEAPQITSNISRKYTWDVISLSVQANVPAILWGDPGIAKTSKMYVLAEQLGLPCEVVIASIREPSDFSGLPIVVDQHGDHLDIPKDPSVVFSPPRWALKAAKEPTLIFFDEFTTAAPNVQSALLRVVFDRVVGDVPLHPGTRIVAAANPPDRAANGYDLAPPLANRFIHIDVEPDSQDWVNWMLNMSMDPEYRKPQKVSDLKFDSEKFEVELRRCRQLFASYIKTRGDQLHKYPEQATAQGKQWCSPRSWDMACQMYAAAQSADRNSEELAMISSAAAIGAQHANEFHTWLRNLDIPEPEVVLKDNSKLSTDRGDIIYATMHGVMSHVRKNVRDGKKEVWTQANNLVYYLFKNGMKDISLTFFADLAKIRPRSVMPNQKITQEITGFFSEAKCPVRKDGL